MEKLKAGYKGIKEKANNLIKGSKEDPKKTAKDGAQVTRKVADMLTDDVLCRGVKWAAGKATYIGKEKMEVRVINQTAKVLKVEFWLEGGTGYSDLSTLLPGKALMFKVALSKEETYHVRLRTTRPDLYAVGSVFAFVPLVGSSIPLIVKGVEAAVSTVANMAEMDQKLKDQSSDTIVVYAGEKNFEVKFTATKEDEEIAAKIDEYFEWLKKESKGKLTQLTSSLGSIKIIKNSEDSAENKEEVTENVEAVTENEGAVTENKETGIENKEPSSENNEALIENVEVMASS